MAASYPTSIKSFTTKTNGSTIDAADVNDLQLEVSAIETDLINGLTNTLTPKTNDGAALGTTALSWSDLFLATGAVLNFANGNYTVTHSSGLLTFSNSFTVTGLVSIVSTLGLTLGSNSSSQFSYARFTTTGGGGNNYLGVGHGSAGLFVGGSNYGFALGTEWAGPLELATNNTVRLAIDSSGNVAIASGAKLNLDGTSGGGDTYIVESSSNNIAFYAGGTNILNVSSDGVGVGRATSVSNRLVCKGTTSDSSAYAFDAINSTNADLLYVRNDGYGYLNDSAWHYSSDRRLKENIEYLTDGLSIIQQLQPAKFDRISGRKNQYGFIAQDMLDVFAAAVHTEDKTGFYTVTTEYIIPVLVKAMQQQQAAIDALKAALLAR